MLYDPVREGIWLFQGASNRSTKDADLPSPHVDTRGFGLVLKDKGTYEPASLVRTKAGTPNITTTPSSGVSPSSSLEASVRMARAQNSRSIQQNSELGTSQDSSTLSPGNKSTSSSEMGASIKDLHEYFISAVLGSLVYFLCWQQNFIPLNSRTLILATSNGLAEKGGAQVINQIELATLDISLTSLGVLVVKAYSDLTPGLQNLPRPITHVNLNEGASLCLAPTGSAAKFYCTFDDVNVEGMAAIFQSQSNLQFGKHNLSSTTATKSLQSKCMDWLSAKGLDTAFLESGGWLYVQITGSCPPYWNQDLYGSPALGDLTIVPWPALLCFQTSNGATRDSQHVCMTNSNYRDPLAFAEDWFIGKDERANLLFKRQKDRQAAEVVSRDQADFDARNLPSNVYSPPVLRRGSIAGSMYPTPPDAPLLGATPNFDGNISSPGNPNPFDSLTAGIPTTGIAGADVDVETWTSGRKARANYNENGTEVENIFGDSMEADMFGTDIMESDFDFFDVPDSVPLENNASSPIMPVLPFVQDVSMKEEADTPDDKNLYSNTYMHDRVGAYQHVPPEVPDILLQPKFDSPAQIPELPSLGAVAVSSTEPSRRRLERSPFNQETVFNKLSKKYNDRGTLLRRSGSLFDKIPFQDSVVSANSKYGVNGQFHFTMQTKRLPSRGTIELPLTGYLSGRRKVRENRQGSVYPCILKETPIVQQALEEPMDYLVESDLGSQASEQDDTSNTTDDPSALLNLQPKRKWDISEDIDISTPYDTLAMDLDLSVGTPQSISGLQMPYIDPDPADWSLAAYFTTLEPDIHATGLSDVECISSAQTLADQAVCGTFRIPGVVAPIIARKRDQVRTTRELMHGLARAASSCLKDFSVCSMRTFLDIQGIPVLNQVLRLPPRPQAPRGHGLEPARLSNPFLLPPPQLEVRRADTKLTILPSAVTFWENLGLGPSQGSKDISAVCAFPNIEGASTNANIFLDQMRSAYESSRFGNHDRAVCKEIADGLVNYSLDPLQQHQQPYAVALKETIGQLFKILRSLTASESNFVVYFVYPNDNGALLVQICHHFQLLFEYYRKALSERKIGHVNELVLQLIPMDFIASHTTLAVPSPTDYFRVAMEVYDRCFDFTSSTASPAIMLERPLPKIIDFKLTSNPSASVLQENTCFHVAYAKSRDERWITAAWTDNRGTQQMTASYCLGRKNEPFSMAFPQVATEIWETTIDYISSKKIHWRIMVAKVGVMDPSELEMWTSLASAETRAQASLTLITVHTDPSLRLLPAPTVLNPSGSTASSVVTPGSTPQALQSSMLSPDVASTPTGTVEPLEPDGDSRLVDLTDQSWGAVLGHRLNNSNSLVDLNLALISGYLIKRGGMNNDQPPIVMEVNIVHSEVVGNPRTFHESLLKEVLLCYRGLGSLARVRGVVDPVKDVRPWHVAAAEKVVEALYMLM